MSGFIGALFGLFGGKKANNQPNPGKGEAFYLDSDSASSLGDVKFMRTPKSIKRSFPTAVGKLNLVTGEVEDSISSMEKRKSAVAPKSVSSTPAATSTSTSTPSSSTPTFKPTTVAPRRSVDSGMDMFRNMARDIKTKK